ncbi:pyridoxal phosphate-dependent aminotransferase [[Eubacterium] cellulosolvens]
MLSTICNLQSPRIFIGVEGDGLISFGSGAPDLPPPEQVFKILPNFKFFKYSLVQGQASLRSALAKIHRNSPGNIVITNGASEALDLCFTSLLKPGEKVLLTRPYYYAYPPLVSLNKGQTVYTNLVKGKIDFNDLDKKIRGCKAALINSPANPTGSVQSPKILRRVERLCRDLRVFLLFDEVYSSLIYEGEHYQPQGEYTININSFSKTFAMCGLRVGYLYSANKEVIDQIVEMKNYKSMNTCLLAQEMANEALKAPRSYIARQLKTWRERRDMIYAGLQELGLELWNPEGAFYVFPKVDNGKKTVLDLYRKYKVITYLGEWFGVKNRIRLSYALDKLKIEEGLKRIKEYLTK